MITYASVSELGSRKLNEDSVNAQKRGDEYIFALADGLGGHEAGEVASKLAVDTAVAVFIDSESNICAQETDADNEKQEIHFKQLLCECMDTAQETILDEQGKLENSRDMKTTAVYLLLSDKNAQWAHIGDSRMYMFSDIQVTERTLDHSVPQILVMQGEISEKDIRSHGDRNKLTRVMGSEWNSPKYVISELKDICSPMSFLLCSDGFWELIVEKDMCRTLKKSKTLEEWLEKMEKIVLKNGRRKDMDNYSAIAVFIRS